MRLSRYFATLSSSYDAELDDLRTDSEGNNVLKKRVADKRKQLSELLMMLEFAPEMVAAAFHGAFIFKDNATIESLLTREANKLPTWSSIQKAIAIEPWAQAMLDTVLSDPHGANFLVTTVGLEYLNRGNQLRTAAAPVVEEEPQETQSHYDEEDAEQDLDEAGADWLAEQGFDRKE